mmetsp:Transcript_2242/g.3951  ORF Transcript_2242/g.3951 Transcript_2242/m.3951 type:complete len:281 (+) Transcript_2242:665-1507(+)
MGGQLVDAAVARSGRGRRSGCGATGGDAAAARLGRMDAGRQLRRDFLFHVVAQHREDLLHKRIKLLLEQQRRVLGLHLLEAHCARSPMHGCIAAHAGARSARSGGGAAEKRREARTCGAKDAGAVRDSSAHAAVVRTARGGLDILLEQVVEGDGVGKPVGERPVVLLLLVDLHGDGLDDLVEQVGAVRLERLPVEAGAEDDEGGKGAAVLKAQVSRDALQQLLLVRHLLLLHQRRALGLQVALLAVNISHARLRDTLRVTLRHVAVGLGRLRRTWLGSRS